MILTATFIRLLISSMDPLAVDEATGVASYPGEPVLVARPRSYAKAASL